MLDVSGCWAVFDPATLSIIGSMSVEAAEELDAQEMDFAGVEFDRVVLFEDEPDYEHFS
jgi:hypothetical protein